MGARAAVRQLQPQPRIGHRIVAADNALPVDAITEVRVLDPYFYTGEAGR